MTGKEPVRTEKQHPHPGTAKKNGGYVTKPGTTLGENKT